MKKINLVIVAAILLVSLVLVFTYKTKNLDIDKTSETYQVLPERILDFELIQMQTGDAAMFSVKRLHPQDFEIEDAYTAVYSDGSRIYIWVSVSGSNERAQELLDLMNLNIKKSEMFYNFREEKIADETVYHVDGMNMDNYYYRHGNRVTWIATDDKDSRRIVEEYMSLTMGILY